MSSDRHDSARAGRDALAVPLRLVAALVAALVVGIGGLVFAVASLVADPSPAGAASSTIVASFPENGSTVGPDDVTAITVTFSEPAPANAGLVLTCDSNPINTPGAVLSDDGLTLSLAVTPPLPEGRCNVGVVLPTGNPTFSFNVRATAAATVPAAETAATPVPEVAAAAAMADVSTAPIWLGRLLSTFGVAVLFGALVLIVAAWPEGVEYVLALRFLRGVWIVGVVGTVIYVSAMAGLLNATNFSTNPAEWFDLLDAGWPGRAAFARLVFVIACSWVAMRPERVIDPSTNMLALGLPALTVVTLGLSRTGGELAAVGLVAAIVHVLAMAVWLGGVVLLARVVLAGPGEQDLVDAVHGFGRISTVAIVATAASGVVQLYRIDGGELFTSSHGRIMLLKTLAVAAMIYIGLTARQIARAKLWRSSELTIRTADRLKRTFGTEAAVGLLILALTSWMLNQAPGKADGSGTSGGAATSSFSQRRSVLVNSSTTAGAVLLDMQIAAEPARVGPNTIRIIVNRPEAGLSGLTVTFSPPAGMGGTSETVINLGALTGAGTAQTSSEAPVYFDVAGAWTITVSGAAANEPFSVSTAIDVATAEGRVQQPNLPAAITTVATTAPPTTPPITAAADPAPQTTA